MPEKLAVFKRSIEALGLVRASLFNHKLLCASITCPITMAPSAHLRYLKRGGVIYIDHEASPYYWISEKGMLASIVKGLTFHANPMLNSLYFGMAGLRIPTIDYTLSDYWFKKEHALNHQTLARVFREEGFRLYVRTDHYLTGSWLPNPLAYIYRLVCRPEMSFWVAKK